MGRSPSEFAIAVGLLHPIQVIATHRETGLSKAVELTQPFALVGRSAGCTVRLINPSVHERHVYIQVLNGRPYFVVLGDRTGVSIDGTAVTEGWLSEREVLQVGEFDLIVSVGENDPNVVTQPADGCSAEDAYLGVSLVGDSTGLARSLLRSPLAIIGRHAKCDLRLLDMRVRSFHAAIVQTPTGGWVVNLRSAERVRVNGKQVRLARLEVGDHIELNGVRLEVWESRAHSSEPNGFTPRVETLRNEGGTITLSTYPTPDAVGDVRQYTILMAKLLALLQDQMAMQQRQTDLLQDIRDAVRGGRVIESHGSESPPVPLQLPANSPPQQVPRTASTEDVPALTDAHEWLLSRLGMLGK
jgi:pSer/pThr/pTyr-binding forkhead associated (FHA) protein